MDETQIGGYSTDELEELLTEINNLAIQETTHGIDICVVDHINLLKFGDEKYGVTDAVNKYTTFFRKQAINWCNTKEQVAMIVISQANRECEKYWAKSKKNNKDNIDYKIYRGDYLLNHFAEGNELERASAIVLTVYSDNWLKIINTAKVGLIKNRDGEPLDGGMFVRIEPKYYMFGDKILEAAREAEKKIPTLSEAMGEEYGFPPKKDCKPLDWGF